MPVIFRRKWSCQCGHEWSESKSCPLCGDTWAIAIQRRHTAARVPEPPMPPSSDRG